jgi:hypothetical protein
LPIDVVSTAQVVANPYDPEYGKLAGAVTTIDTRLSEFNKFRFRMQNFMPRMRHRDGAMMGVEAATPRMTLTVPLIRNFREIGAVIAEGGVHEFINVAVQRLVDKGLRVGVTPTGRLPWAEIDDAADLRFARTVIYPRLRRSAGSLDRHGDLVPAVA